MKTTITTKDNHTVTVTHIKEFDPCDLAKIKDATLRELYQIPTICGIKFEEGEL